MRELDAERIVVKIGTNTICRADGTIDQNYLIDVARQVRELRNRGIQIIVVTSGAIGTGSAELGLDGKYKDIAMKQACAAVGQAILMMAWRDAFRLHGLSVGQVLLTYGAFSNRARYLELRKSMDELFRLGVVPIINENDVIATDEIDEIFGDNDKLSALVASKMDADLLILLTDVDGLYDRNPDNDPDARLIPTIDEITKDIERIAGNRKNERSTGGMRTKIDAARIAMESGCNMIIANGHKPNIIIRIVEGEELGTLFTPQVRYSNRERWIIFTPPRGKLNIDEGAESAIHNGMSLLPCGVLSVEGKFKKGDVVRINGVAKGIVNYSSREISEMVKICQLERKEGRHKGHDRAVIESSDIVIHQ
ncbi:MAG: glutamate 5-kinase [Euryarchaeota archaeon]|nr:glutamate 5-kinase [Euryarchaeota archaeon]